MAKKSFKLVKASAALAVTAAALTPVMAAEASTAKAVELKAEVVLGGKFKEALALNTPAGVQITWGKHLVTAINKWQTVTGKGSDGKTYIKKLYARNYPLYVLDQDLGEVEAGSELVKPSIRVMYRDGKIYTQAPERFTMSSNYNTKDLGEQKVLISYNHNGNRITKLLTYTVVAGEVEFANVTSSVDQAAEVLSVNADVKNLKEGEKVELVVFAGRDVNAPLAPVQAEVKDGKVSVKSAKLPAGNHSFILRSGDVKTEAANFVVEAPMVKDVKAINGKDHVVEFNKAVDKITAENKANYEISVNNGAALAAGSYTVAVDEKDPTKVKITLADAAALSNGAYVSVKVKKAILDTNLKPLADDFTKTFTFVDNSAAAIEKVEVDGNDLKVTFNDYVSSVGLVKVNGVVKPATAASPYSKELVISGGATGLDNGTYSVQIANVEDIANINAAPGAGTPNLTTFTSGNFTISNVTVAPTVSKVEKVDEDTFKVTFNKAVTQPTVVAKKNGLDLTVAAPVSGAAGKEWTVTVSNNGGVALYNAGETSVNLALNISGFKAVSDNVVGDAVNQSVTLSKDTIAPVVETRFNEIVDADTTAGVNEVFNIKFDEVIGSLDSSKIILTDKDGVRRVVSDANIVADSTGALTILQVESTAVQSSGAILSGTYTISLGAGTVKDVALNPNAATSVAFTKATGTTTDFAVTATAAANVITLPFGTPMTNSAIDLSNYKLDNKALPAGTIAYFDGSKNTVKIELPAGSVARTQAAVLTVSSSVVSEAGAKLDTASRNQVIATGLVDNVKPTLVSAKKLTSTTIEATFSEDLAAVTDAANTQDDFVVKINGVNFAVSAVTDGTPGDNKVVLTVAPYNVDQTLTVAMADATINIADAAGNTAEVKTVVTATK